MRIEIEGTTYKLKEKSAPKLPSKLLPYIAMTMALTSYGPGSGRQKIPPVSDEHLIEEYKLILQKKSKLSRSLRDAAVARFNSVFEKVVIENSNP